MAIEGHFLELIAATIRLFSRVLKLYDPGNKICPIFISLFTLSGQQRSATQLFVLSLYGFPFSIFRTVSSFSFSHSDLNKQNCISRENTVELATKRANCMSHFIFSTLCIIIGSYLLPFLESGVVYGLRVCHEIKVTRLHLPQIGR